MKKHLSFLPLAVLFLAILDIQAFTAKTTAESLNDIAMIHLSSMPNIILPMKTQKIGMVEIPAFFSVKDLSGYERYSAAYRILAQALGNTLAPETVINLNAIKELELVLGSHTPTNSLTNLLVKEQWHGYSVSTIGHAYLTFVLCNPTSNVQILKDRQTVIQALLDNKKVFKRLLPDLIALKKCEETLFSCLQEENAFEKQIMDGAYPTYKKPLLRNLNGLNGSALFQDYNVISGKVMTWTVGPVIIPLVASWFSYAGLKTFTDFKEARALFTHGATHPGWLAIGLFATSEAFLIWAAKKGADAQRDFLTFTHKKVNSIAVVIRTAHDLVEAVDRGEAPGLEKLAYIQHARNLFSKNSTLDADYKKLISIVSTKTFDPTPDGKLPTFSRKGRVLAAYYLLRKIRTQLTSVMLAIAELDAYMACASLYARTNHTHQNKFVFATYLQNETASITADGIWNPFVGADKAIENNIQLGDTLPLNVILTGPNAGGKSTFLKGLTLDVLLAQTIGIVPASSFSFTPFTKITTYMNISDDTSGGNSLFKSEVLRAQELMDTIEKLDKKYFAFSIMDEMFSGTSPKEGEAATYAVAEDLGCHTNSILLLATHFPKLKELESSDKNFKNYQVRVVYNENGTFSYPYKLTEGAADQTVAIDILKDQGFKGSILDKANKILGK